MNSVCQKLYAVLIVALCSSCDGGQSKGVSYAGKPAGTKTGPETTGDSEAKPGNRNPSKTNSKKIEQGKQVADDLGQAQDPGGAPSIANRLKGRWVEPCKWYENLQESREKLVEFSDTEEIVIKRSYTDKDCKYKQYEDKEVFSYRLGVASKGVADAVEIDETFKKLTTTLFAQALVDQHNMSRQNAPSDPCYQIEWKVNTEVDMTSCTSPKPPRFTIVKISASELQFGLLSQEANGTSAALRPTKLDTLAFKRIE